MFVLAPVMPGSASERFSGASDLWIIWNDWHNPLRDQNHQSHQQNLSEPSKKFHRQVAGKKKIRWYVLALNQSKHWSCASYMHPDVVHPNFRGKITLVPMKKKINRKSSTHQLLRHSLFHQPGIVPKTQCQLPSHSVPVGGTGNTGWSYGSSQGSLTNGSCQSWSNGSADMILNHDGMCVSLRIQLVFP